MARRVSAEPAELVRKTSGCGPRSDSQALVQQQSAEGHIGLAKKFILYDVTEKPERPFGQPGTSGGRVVKNQSAGAGDMNWIPGLGRSHMPRGS